MKKFISLLMLFSVVFVAGCSKSDPNEKEAGFKNDKPVPPEDGGGTAPTQ
ncbi:MAG: hypothetical protein K8R88_09375 [Armatimonadetes bacterium]|nr:hypothetical protein [Armatimonadota bacterium]